MVDMQLRDTTEWQAKQKLLPEKQSDLAEMACFCPNIEAYKNYQGREVETPPPPPPPSMMYAMYAFHTAAGTHGVHNLNKCITQMKFWGIM